MVTLFIDKFNGVSQWTGNDIVATTDPLGKYNRAATLASTGTGVRSFSKLIYNPSKLYQISFDYLGAPKNIESGVNLGCILSISDGGSLSGISQAIAGSIKNSAPPMCPDRIVMPNDCIDKCYGGYGGGGYPYCLAWSNNYIKFYHSGVVPLNNNGVWKRYSVAIRTNDENIRIGISDFIYADYPDQSFAGDCYFANLLVTDLDGPTYSPTQSITPSISTTSSITFDKLQPIVAPKPQPIPTPVPMPSPTPQPVIAPLPAPTPPQSTPSVPVAPQPGSGLVPQPSSVNNINNIGSFNTNNSVQKTVQINSNLIIGVAGGVGGLIVVSVAVIGYKCYTRSNDKKDLHQNPSRTDQPPLHSVQAVPIGFSYPQVLEYALTPPPSLEGVLKSPLGGLPNIANNQATSSQSSSSLPIGQSQVRVNYATSFQCANPLLNDPELLHLLTLAQATHGDEGTSQLIDLGENHQQYLKFQSLRKAHGDAEAVKLILEREDSIPHATYKAQTASIASDTISNIFFLAKELIEHKSLISYIMPEFSNAFSVSTAQWIGLHFATTVSFAYFLPAAPIAKIGFVVASTGIFALREIIRDDINSIDHNEPVDSLTSFATICWKPTLLPAFASFTSDLSTKSLINLSPAIVGTNTIMSAGIGAISCYTNNAAYHEPKMHQSLIEQVIPYAADSVAAALSAISIWKADHSGPIQYIKHGFIALSAVILTDQVTKAIISLIPDETSLALSEFENNILGENPTESNEL